MKNRILSLLCIAGLLCATTACREGGEVTDITELTDITAETPTEPTEPTEDTTVEPYRPGDTTKPPEKQKIKLNTDLLDEFGMTFGELEKKYGEAVEIGNPGQGGGIWCEFENNYRRYVWYIGLEEDFQTKPFNGRTMELQEDGTFAYVTPEFALLPQDDLANQGIINVRVEDLFSITSSIDISELEKISELKYLDFIDISEYGHYGRDYILEYLYGDIKISVLTNQKETIEPNDCYVIITQQ